MSIVITIIGGYVLLLAIMYIFQSKLIFLPSPIFLATPQEAGLQAEDLWIKPEAGVRLHGWYFPNDEAEYVVVLSHGNAGNISNRLDIARVLNDTGLAVVLYDYRGYGQSSGQPGEEGFYRDIEAVINHLRTEEGFSEEQMILYGRSLGGAVASYAAGRFDVSGLVLDSAFKSLKSMVADLYPFVPAALARYEFPTERYLQDVTGLPVMIMHSPGDNLVRISHSRYLYEIAGEPKHFVELRGGHNSSFLSSVDLVKKSWKEFLSIVDSRRKSRIREGGN